MRKNGFTLIELLAVIVILAIIALIATPIILGIINDAREESNERSVELYASAVRNGIAAYQLREGKEVLPKTYTKETFPFEVEYDGKVDCADIIISEDGKVSLDKCTVNGGTKEYSYGIKEESEVAKVCTYVDSEDDIGDAIGKIDLSDVVTCGTESFYVMENDGNDITMLAKYNLEVGGHVDWDDPNMPVIKIDNPTGIQNSKAKGGTGGISYGVIAFSTAEYWYDSTNKTYIVDSNYVTEGRSYPYVYGDYKDAQGNQQNIIYPYVEAYEDYLKEDLKVSSASATLMSFEQAEKLGIKHNGGYYIESNLSWFNSTAFWLGSASDSTQLWSSNSGPGSNFNTEYYIGIRPVITISTSEIQ